MVTWTLCRVSHENIWLAQHAYRREDRAATRAHCSPIASGCCVGHVTEDFAISSTSLGRSSFEFRFVPEFETARCQCLGRAVRTPEDDIGDQPVAVAASKEIRDHIEQLGNRRPFPLCCSSPARCCTVNASR